MKIKKNGKVITLTEGDLKRIVKRVLREEAGGGCKCPDGTLKPECCNTSAQKHYRAMKNVKSKEYFQKNPKGTITMDASSTFPSIIMINGSKDGLKGIYTIDGVGDVPSFGDLWKFNGGGRGFRTGSTGKFNYTYDNGEILITPAPGNEGQSHGQIDRECGCSFEVDEETYINYEKEKN